MPLPSSPELLCGKWLIWFSEAYHLLLTKAIQGHHDWPSFLRSLSLPSQGNSQPLLLFPDKAAFLHGILKDSYIWYSVYRLLPRSYLHCPDTELNAFSILFRSSSWRVAGNSMLWFCKTKLTVDLLSVNLGNAGPIKVVQVSCPTPSQGEP